MDQKTAFKVSVITVVRNGAATIAALIDSVRRFKTPEVEFIILDGLSSDHTLQIIKDNEDVIDFWKSEKDRGIYDAMNKAVDLARGEWLIFMGADDQLLEGFQSARSQLKEPDTIYYGKVFFHDLITTGKIKDNYMLTKTNICHQAIFYPRQVFQKYRYQEEYIVCADYVLNLNCWDDQDFKFRFIDELIARYPHGGYSFVTEDKQFTKDKSFLFKKHLGLWAYLRYRFRLLKKKK